MLRNLAVAATMAAACTSSFATTAFVQGLFNSGNQISVTDLRPHDDIVAGYTYLGGGTVRGDRFSYGQASADFTEGLVEVITTTGPDSFATSFRGLVSGEYMLTPYSSVTVTNPFYAGMSRSTNAFETGELTIGLQLAWLDGPSDEVGRSVEDGRTLTFGQTFDDSLSATLINNSPMERQFFYITSFGMNLNAPAVTAPVPEPETYALMLAGLGLVGWQARRRRGAAAAAPLATA